MARIEDYALIGDLETAALVERGGSIDWLCFPRFDSNACFAALLGDTNNGRWLLAPKAGGTTSRRYRGETLVLETTWENDEGAVRVYDFMPPRDEAPDIVRIVEGVRGRVEMRSELVIRFDYGHIVPWVRRVEGARLAVAGPDGLCFRTPAATRGENMRTISSFTVEKGDRVPFVLTWYPSHGDPPPVTDPERAFTATDEFWREWIGACTASVPDEWREALTRSLIVLKALIYEPTGGIVAAPTTSLPEWIGGIRNWDYRYCWLRDATLTLLALLHADYAEEAAAWRAWLLRAIAGDPADVQIMYGVAGERRLTEQELPWLAGYEGSAPVRIGNAASEQLQIDVFGEVLDALYQARIHGLAFQKGAWDLQRVLLEYLASIWHEPDEGIWEIRGERRHFVHSKVMAWVAFDRAVRSVEDHGLEGSPEEWRRTRDEIRADVLAHGYDEELGSFVQSYGSKELDASLLLIPLVGFLPASDARVRGTIAAIEKDLVVDGLVLRYRPANSVDGLPPGEGVFLPCSFWLVDCLELIGRHDDAHALFERLIGLANDVGLLSEEYDPRAKRLLGNFPQAFTHLALVNSAFNVLSHLPSPMHRRHAHRESHKQR
ncbi:MAG TPA: glycoside hydrolase family 15 protein [Gaiellaceae bacterium]|jgi:GH15 family glucan-1,4-alpha-glucosidase|nr:glycoside hydrolase family 15 protein [Gaiellaceae bacterium]